MLIFPCLEDQLAQGKTYLHWTFHSNSNFETNIGTISLQDCLISSLMVKIFYHERHFFEFDYLLFQIFVPISCSYSTLHQLIKLLAPSSSWI